MACLPPPPGTVEPPPPTLDQRTESIARRPVIVAGQVIAVHRHGQRARFRVTHVYKGALRPGAVITIENGWGENAPMCAGLIPPPPITKAGPGIISYDDPARPALNYLDDDVRDRMVARGLIQPAALRRRR